MICRQMYRRFFAAFTISLITVLWFSVDITFSAESLDEFMRSAERGQRATVEGVVSGVWPKQGRLGLIDSDEFQKCKSVGCAKITLPVLWDGEMPEVASTVHVEGKVTSEGRLMFAAESMKIVSTPDKPDFKGGIFK